MLESNAKRKIEKICKKQDLRKKMRREVLLGVLFCCVMLCGCTTNVDESLSWELESEELVSQQSISEVSETDISQEQHKVYVYVCGAVVQPGVYEIMEGSRVYEAVDMAGGITQEADETCINMARVVTDGEQIMILTKEEVAQRRVLSSDEKRNAQHVVNINTASVAELTQLSGVGESRAQAIISYREKNGAFQSIEQIKNVSGIKDALYERIKDYITIG